MKNHYKLIAVDLSRQNELYADPKAIQQIEFIGQLKELDTDYNATDAGKDQSMKNQRNKIKIFWSKCNSIVKDGKLSRSKS